MATSLITVLDSMRDKIDALDQSVTSLRARNKELEEENEALRRTVSDTAKERDRAQLESEFLTVSYRLAEDPNSIIEARRLISRLIRNIDRCIEMLKE